MRQLVYISTAKGEVPPGELRAIEAQSQRLNKRVGLTGLLLFDGVRYLQVLEGEPAALAATYARIAADPRHHAMVKLSEIEVSAAQFGRWDMLARNVAHEKVQLGAMLGPLLGNTDRSIRGLFESFVELRDRAA